ncbi:MAG: hypothetical protein KDD51_04325 [Bdellovibrionales bacterium]|nr:hypothetical protein [Bdellovibrionales bacterium]MCB0419279.1 hypothetical protein [Bdellovibrionales bacterium]
MKVYRSIFILFLVGLPAFGESELGELRECVDSYYAVRQYFSARIPAQILALDRRLYHLDRRAVYLDANYKLLETQLQGAQASKYDRLMVGNALIHCEEQLQSYEKYMASLYYFFLSACVSLVAFVVYLLYVKFTGGRWNAPPLRSPQDKSPHAAKPY